MMLTPEDIKRLEMPLKLEHHEARAKGKDKSGKKQQWLIYITQEGIIPLLNEIDPSWTWEVRDASKWDKYAVVTGRLTLKDVFRDGRGGNSPNSSTASTDEDTEKGAETDALKRAAMRFGVGLYLRGVDSIWVEISEKPWEDEKVALERFAVWYKREFGVSQAQNGGVRQPQQQNVPTPASVSPRPTLAADLNASTGTTAKAGDGSAKTFFFPDDAAADLGRVDKLPRDVEGLPILGTLNMKALGKLAQDEKLVKGRIHFANLIDLLWRDGEIPAASKPETVIDAIRKHESAKNLAKEGAS